MRFTIAGTAALAAVVAAGAGMASADASTAGAPKPRADSAGAQAVALPHGMLERARADASVTGRTAGQAVRASAAAAETTVIVQLKGDPAGSGSRRRAELRAAQRPAAAGIRTLGGEVLADYQSSYNGLKVRITQNRLDAVLALPGVAAVHPVTRVTPRSSGPALPMTGAPGAWGSGLSPANLGAGVKLGVIDSGIDYTHADFGGPGTVAAYTAARAAGTVAAPAALFGAAAPKVKGGVDLVGDSYNPDRGTPGYQPVAHPDPNPLDCNGHGTHVAGIAAGFGVLDNGRTYRGRYNSYTLAAKNWLVDPGVAPAAELYAIRIFGCEGGSEMLLDAIEWAVEHDLDVLNVSLGSTYGTRDAPESVAADNATKAGLIVVAPSGDEGGGTVDGSSVESRYLTSAPAAADGAISVAANDPNKLTGSSPNPNHKAVWKFSSAGPRYGDSRLKPDVTAPGVGIASAASGTGIGAARMSGTSMATAFTSGIAALVKAAHPGWTDVRDLKAAVVNTAHAAKITGYRAGKAGNGLVQAGEAGRTLATALGPDGTASLSFGFAVLFTEWTATRTLTVHNHADSPVAFTVKTSKVPGVPHTVTPDRTSLTVPAHGHATLTVRLTVRPRDVTPYLEDPPFFAELSGLVTLTPQDGGNGGVALRVPYHFVPKAPSSITSTVDTATLIERGVARATSTNRGVTWGWTRWFSWGLEDADEPWNRVSDVKAVGLDTEDNYLPLIFTIATYDRMSNAASNEYDIYFDFDTDGTDDLVAIATDRGLLFDGRRNGKLAIVLCDLRTLECLPDEDGGGGLLTLNTTYVELWLSKESIRRVSGPVLTPADDFDYRVVARGPHDGPVDVVAGSARVNIGQPALDGPLSIEVPRTGSGRDDVFYGADAYAHTPARGFLVLAPRNAFYNQVQLIPVRPSSP